MSDSRINKMTVIIKPTHQCNFQCKYCYLPQQRTKKERMSYQTLENTINQLASTCKKVRLIWHGGEPTLMGKTFFAKALEVEERNKSCSFTNSIQTNAGNTLTEELIDFFEKYQFNVGISLDGPKYIHDQARIYKDGSPTFSDVIKSVNVLRKRKIKTGAICVLSKLNIGKIEQLYNFFKNLEINVKINPLIPSGNAMDKPELAISYMEYSQAVIQSFNLWFWEKEPKIVIDTIYGYIETILTNTPSCCSNEGSCAEHFLGIDPLGEVYPCGRWTGVSKFNYGNLNDVPIYQLLEGNLRKRIRDRKKILHKFVCKTCRWKTFCNGGCMHNAYLANGDIFSKDLYCESIKYVYEYISKAIDGQLQIVEL